jgi:hypothetical protein
MSAPRRWLAADALKPWRHRSWIFPRDPHRPQGLPGAGPVSADLRRAAARRRRVRPQRRREAQRPLPTTASTRRCRLPAPGDARRSESPAAAPLPTWPPATSTAPGSSASASPRAASGRSPPWSSRSWGSSRTPPQRVFWVVDNGASHRNWVAAARHAYPNAQMARLPVHASWLNRYGCCLLTSFCSAQLHRVH